MAAPRTPGDYGGGDEHGGQSRRLHSNRRRVVVGLLCFVLSLVELGGLLIKVYLLLTNTSFVENPPYCIAYNCLCAQETPLGLPKFAKMSKLSKDAVDSERYKALGFKAQFDGKPSGANFGFLHPENESRKEF